PPAYRTRLVVPERLPEFLDALDAREVAAVAFLSPSSARGLAASLPGGTLRPLSGRTMIASIGPTTSAAIAELGARVDIEPPQRSAAALAAAIVRRVAA
ncbi:MAG TPA: uroporphyrinogen-III synthase, partial [Vicinamibacterales bacterium]|nr:uroporphyrinogen-III synthase [Vicinamibacterales bacterium]